MAPRIKKAQKDDKPKVSVYGLLNNWINDGSKTTEVPVEVLQDRNISSTYLLYYFRSSKTIAYLSPLFNNYSIYELDRIECFKFIKSIVLKTGYKPRFVAKSQDIKTAIYKLIKKKHPLLKPYEIPELVKAIDNSEDRDAIYESLGLNVEKVEKIKSKPKKERGKKEEAKEEIRAENSEAFEEVNDAYDGVEEYTEIFTMDMLIGAFAISKIEEPF